MRTSRADQFAAARDRYAAGFEPFLTQPGRAAEAGWLKQLRAGALAMFRATGFPTTRHEEWKYVDLTPLLTPASSDRPATPALLNGKNGNSAIKDDSCYRLIFHNGRLAADISSKLPSGVTLQPLSQAIGEHSELLQQHLGRYARCEDAPFVALNTAFFTDGALIHLPGNTRLDKPVHLLFRQGAGSDAMIASRNLILVGDNCEASFIEEYHALDGAASFTNTVTEFAVGRNSQVEHHRVQLESEQAFHIGAMQIHCGADTHFRSHSFALGGKLARGNVTAVMGGENIECTLNGLVLAGGEQIVDNHTVMDHAQPRCTSHELYAHILQDKSRAVFNGKIFVRQDAQKTDAKQSNRTLLLSREAEIDTKPQLEIFADDVKCTHGATVGQLDEDALFYLRSRGLDASQARDMLTVAFASEIISQVRFAPLREQLEKELLQRLSPSAAPSPGSGGDN